MELIRITDSRTSDARRLIALHGEAFPEYDRFRETSLLANMIDHEPSMHFNGIYEDGVPAGFCSYWDLDNCYYVHFIAVEPRMRNQKIGQQVLEWIAANLHRPVFLESEVPYNDITARRLEFYRRHGLRELAEDPPTLADVRRGGHPQWLMGTQSVADLDRYLVAIRDRVYFATGEEK